MKELIKRPHPALAHIPITLYPVSLFFLIIAHAQGSSIFMQVSYWCFLLGCFMVIPVAGTGVLDYRRLKSYFSREGERLLKLHLANGSFITALSVMSGLYFYLRSPLVNPGLLPIYTIDVSVLTILMITQGYIAALMVYQQHIGIDGDTR